MTSLFRSVLVSTALALAGASQAQESFYVQVDATKQGILKGEAKSAKRLEWLPGVAFGYKLSSPIDATSGLPTGRMQHGLVSFTKEWGAASPQLFQAIATNEVLKSVLFEFTRVSPEGIAEVYYKVKLTNARVTGFRQFRETRTGPELDSVSLSYQTIEVESIPGKTVAISEVRDIAARSVGSAFGLSYSMTNGDFKVDLPDEEVELRFLDLNGALVRSLTARGGEVRFDARTLGMQPGMYLLKANVAGQPLGTVPVSIAK